jgi:hypothetical protein
LRFIKVLSLIGFGTSRATNACLSGVTDKGHANKEAPGADRSGSATGNGWGITVAGW